MTSELVPPAHDDDDNSESNHGVLVLISDDGWQMIMVCNTNLSGLPYLCTLSTPKSLIIFTIFLLTRSLSS